MNILFAADTSFYYFGEDYPGDTAAFAAMAEVRERFNKADFTVINLESTIGNRENYVPIRKNGPNQMSAPAFAKYIEYLAPSAAGLANNHMGDFGDAPIFHTIDTLKELGVQPFGAGANIRDAYKPARFEKSGSKVSVIAVCENEFGIAKEDKAGSAGYSLGRVTAAIRDARADGSIPVIFFHGGNEFFAFPAPAKKELYRHFVDIGAGAVVGMHTHCPQGYEVYNGAPIIYSMGNFFFPASNNTGRQRFKTWEYGYMCELSFENNKVEINELIPYRQDFSGVHLLCGEERAYFAEYLNVISAPIADDALLQKYFEAWSVKTSPLSKMRRSIDLSYDNMSRVKNLLCCEAHNDVLKMEAIVRFEGREASLEALCADIEKLQEMEIPR